jgi:hypothetical protein
MADGPVGIAEGRFPKAALTSGTKAALTSGTDVVWPDRLRGTSQAAANQGGRGQRVVTVRVRENPQTQGFEAGVT